MGFGLLLAHCLAPAVAQDLPVPSFWDPQYRFERPDTGAIRLIRFITEDDYPPFNFALPDGSLTGFNVELARAVCEELKIACTIQPRRWDTLIPALSENRADAAIASLAMNAANRVQLDFTAPYYKTPARFVAKRAEGEAAPSEILPETVAGWPIGVEAKTAHEAFLRAFFPQAEIRSFASRAEAQDALKAGQVKLVFGDGVSLSLWLNGAEAANCCAFAGGPFTESRFFGEGVGIAVRKGNGELRRALDWGLRRVHERGLYAELYLKFFPIGFF